MVGKGLQGIDVFEKGWVVVVVLGRDWVGC